MNTVSIAVVAHNRTAAAFQQLNAQIQASSARVRATTQQMQDRFQAVGREIGDLRTRLGNVAYEQMRLRAASSNAADEMQRLSHQVNSLGSAAPQALRNQLARAQQAAQDAAQAVRHIDSQAMLLAGSLQIAANRANNLQHQLRQAANARNSFVGNLSAAIRNFRFPLPSGIAAWGAAIGAAVAPIIGQTIGAAVLLGVGGGALAAGIAMALRDPVVQAAWKSFGERARESLKGFAEPFKAPMIGAAGTFGGVMERNSGTFAQMGQTIAPAIDKLASGVSGMIERMLPGIQKALEASRPLIDAFAAKLPQIGDAMKSFFESIARGGPAAKNVLNFLLDFATGFIVGLGYVIEYVTKFYSFMLGIWGKIFSFIGDVFSGIKNAAITAFTFLTKIALSAFGNLLTGAAAAFSWMPEIGPKLEQAAKQFNAFKDRVNNELDGIRDKNVNVSITLERKLLGPSLGGAAGYRGLASGGISTAAGGGGRGGLTLVGERGAELVQLPQGSRVYPHANTQQMLGSGGGGGATYNVTINASPLSNPADVGRATVEAIRAFERTSGAGWRAA